MKVCLICFGFNESNIRLQPWRYIYEISREMTTKGILVEIISDGCDHREQKDRVGCINVHRLRRLRYLPFCKNRNLLKLVYRLSPDIILWSVGPTSFYLYRTFKEINIPIIGLWMGTHYSVKEITDLGLNEIIRNFHVMRLYIFSSLIPHNLIKKCVISNCKELIVLNTNNKNNLIHLGVVYNKINIIPPGISQYDLDIPNIDDIWKLRKRLNLSENDFVILYLGSPLSLRGIDTLINAISIIHAEIGSFRLIILSRRSSDSLINEENNLNRLILNSHIEDNVSIVSGYLDSDLIKKFITLADVVALPFKLVQSDTPISILEAMALRKLVISTNIDGIPELLDQKRGLLVNCNDPQSLAKALYVAYTDPQMRTQIEENAREYMINYPSWEQITSDVISILDKLK